MVEDDKLQKAIDKAIEQVDSHDAQRSPTRRTSISRLSRSRAATTSSTTTIGRDDVEDAPIVRFVNKMLLDAIRRGASDIHFEPYEKHLPRALPHRRRAEGDRAAAGAARTASSSARLKVMSRLDIAERRVPQDGRIKMRLSKNRAIDFRVSTCPTLFGEKIVTAYPRSRRSAMLGHRRAGLRADPEGALPQVPRQAPGHDPGHRPHRQRQDGVALHRPQHPQPARTSTSRPPRTRRKSTCPASTRSTSTTRSG